MRMHRATRLGFNNSVHDKGGRQLEQVELAVLLEFLSEANQFNLKHPPSHRERVRVNPKP